MKKNFVYVLSAFIVASFMLIQVPAQALTKTHDGKTMPRHEKMAPKHHQKKCVTGGAAEIQKCKKDRDKKEKMTKKEQKKY